MKMKYNVLTLGLASLVFVSLPCTQVNAASATPSAESRLKQLEDYQSIQQLLATYVTVMDAGDWQSYANVFADDGELNFLAFHLKGHDAILGAMDPSRRQTTAPPAGTGSAAAAPTGTPRTLRHTMSNVLVHLDGDHATSTARWVTLSGTPGSPPAIGGTGIYHDKLTRIKGKWKIQERVISTDLPPPAPATSK
jgi:uncharacterized protein (TIGR02246 family)